MQLLFLPYLSDCLCEYILYRKKMPASLAGLRCSCACTRVPQNPIIVSHVLFRLMHTHTLSLSVPTAPLLFTTAVPCLSPFVFQYFNFGSVPLCILPSLLSDCR